MASTSAGRIVQGFEDDHDHGKLIGLHFVRLHSLNKAELDDVIGDLLGKDNGTGRYRLSLAEPYNRRVLLKKSIISWKSPTKTCQEVLGLMQAA